jgi:hypothetical protein
MTPKGIPHSGANLIECLQFKPEGFYERELVLEGGEA